MGRAPSFRAQAVDHDGEERRRRVLFESGGRRPGAVRAPLHELERLDLLTDAVLVDLDLGGREPAEDLALLAADHEVHRNPGRAGPEGGRPLGSRARASWGAATAAASSPTRRSRTRAHQALQAAHDRPVQKKGGGGGGGGGKKKGGGGWSPKRGGAHRTKVRPLGHAPVARRAAARVAGLNRRWRLAHVSSLCSRAPMPMGSGAGSGVLQSALEPGRHSAWANASAMRAWPSAFACRRSSLQRRGSEATGCAAKSTSRAPLRALASVRARAKASDPRRSGRASGMTGAGRAG